MRIKDKSEYTEWPAFLQSCLMHFPIYIALRRFAGAAAVAFFLIGCGGGGDGPQESEMEQPFSRMVLTHELTEGSLQPLEDPVRLKATNGVLLSTIASQSVTLNGDAVSGPSIRIADNALVLSLPLNDGRNQVVVYAPDNAGNATQTNFTIWAGVSTVTGRVLDADGNPVVGATVVAALGDDQSVKASTTTDDTGGYSLHNFPAKTVLVTATGPNGLSGFSSGHAGTDFEDLVLRPFGTPVSVANNDFHLGTEGWISDNGRPLNVEPHVEHPGESPRASRRRLPGTDPADLSLDALGSGHHSARYTFTPPVMSQSVRIRYRVQALLGEEPGEAAFRVVLRSQSGAAVAASSAVHALSEEVIATDRSAQWRDLTIPLNVPGESVEVVLTLSNVGLSSFSRSRIIVDYLDTPEISINAAKVFDIDNAPLRYLSASSHPYFGGNTRVNASFSIKGAANTRLTNVALHVSQGGHLVATGRLVDALVPTIYRDFDAQHIALDDPQLAFEIPSSEFKRVRTESDAPLVLTLVATNGNQEVARYDLGPVSALSRWTRLPRYGTRDELRGGDDWITPSAREVLAISDVTWGDFSNMNAGSFAPNHAMHSAGMSVDGWYAGYQKLDAAAAGNMLKLLNQDGVGQRARYVYVTHKAESGDAFYDAYKDVVLLDGRKASDVIKSRSGHATHFHLALN